MPTLYVQKTTSSWQYRGDAEETYTDFALTSANAKTLEFGSAGALSFRGNDNDACNDVQKVSMSASIVSGGTGYSVTVKCGAAGTETTGYFSAGTIDDFTG